MKVVGRLMYCNKYCEICGSHSGVAKDSDLPGCDAATRHAAPVVWKDLSPFTVRVTQILKILPNIRNHMANDSITSHKT